MSTELAWAAGFYDGEGCLTTLRYRGRQNGYTQPQMMLAQVELQPLQRFLAAVEAGRIKGPYGPHKGQKQPQWRWTVCSRGDVKHVLEVLWPYLSDPKKEQALRAWPLLCPQTSN